MENEESPNMVRNTSNVVKARGGQTPSPSQPQQKAKRRLPWKMWFILSLLISTIVYITFFYVYGSGGYSGYVRMIHRVGAIKTWEGELDKRKQGGSYHEEDIFRFSVLNADVAAKIQEAEQTGEWVTVHYKEYIKPLPWRGKTPIIVHDITHAGETKKLADR